MKGLSSNQNPALNRSTVTEVLNIMGALYSTAVFMAIANAMMVLGVINNERVVFYREKAAGTYSSWPFAMVQVRERGFWRRTSA